MVTAMASGKLCGSNRSCAFSESASCHVDNPEQRMIAEGVIQTKVSFGIHAQKSESQLWYAWCESTLSGMWMMEQKLEPWL